MRTRFFRIIAALWLGSFVSTAFAAPDIQQWRTPNGVRVLFVQDDILPMLDVRVLFDAASSRDDGLPGLAALTNGLLAEGAAGKSAQQIAEDFESVGAKIDNAALRDMAYVGVRTLTRERYLDRAITTLAEVLTQPDFPPQAFERELARMKVARQGQQAVTVGHRRRGVLQGAVPRSPVRHAGRRHRCKPGGDHTGRCARVLSQILRCR